MSNKEKEGEKGMSDQIDELIETARERNEETEQKLRTIEAEQELQRKQDAERRERLSKGIGERFKGVKQPMKEEMEKDLQDKQEAKMLRKRREIAESLGMDIDQFEQYLKLKGDISK